MYNSDFYDKFYRNIENMGKINLPDHDRYTKMLENIGRINLPDPDRYTRILENMGKINLPDHDRYTKMLENIGRINLPDPDRYTRILENMGKINLPDPDRYTKMLESMGRIDLPSFDKILSINEALSNFPNIVSNIDWTDFEFSEENLKEANDILDNEIPPEQVTEEVNQKQCKSKLIVALMIFINIITFLDSAVNVVTYVEEKLPVVIDYYEQHIAEDKSKSDRQSIRWLNNELKRDVAQQITQNFRIVTKNDLEVRNGKSIDAKIQGKLNHGDVVQIIEKKRNWTYISFSNYQDGEVIEGWVFTRYLKQIK